MVCASCQRPVCGEHLASSDPPECSECAARRPEARQQQEARRRTWREEDDYQYYGEGEQQLEESGWDEVAALDDDFDDGDGGDFGDS